MTIFGANTWTFDSFTTFLIPPSCTNVDSCIRFKKYVLLFFFCHLAQLLSVYHSCIKNTYSGWTRFSLITIELNRLRGTFCCDPNRTKIGWKMRPLVGTFLLWFLACQELRGIFDHFRMCTDSQAYVLGKVLVNVKAMVLY